MIAPRVLGTAMTTVRRWFTEAGLTRHDLAWHGLILASMSLYVAGWHWHLRWLTLVSYGLLIALGAMSLYYAARIVLLLWARRPAARRREAARLRAKFQRDRAGAARRRERP